MEGPAATASAWPAISKPSGPLFGASNPPDGGTANPFISAITNPFAPTSTNGISSSSPGSSSHPGSFSNSNPFGNPIPASNSSMANPFSINSQSKTFTGPTPFGATSKAANATASNPFLRPSADTQSSASGSMSKAAPFGSSSTTSGNGTASIFGVSATTDSGIKASPFNIKPSSTATSIFGAPSGPDSNKTISFGAPAPKFPSTTSTSIFSATPNIKSEGSLSFATATPAAPSSAVTGVFHVPTSSKPNNNLSFGGSTSPAVSINTPKNVFGTPSTSNAGLTKPAGISAPGVFTGASVSVFGANSGPTSNNKPKFSTKKPAIPTVSAPSLFGAPSGSSTGLKKALNTPKDQMTVKRTSSKPQSGSSQFSSTRGGIISTQSVHENGERNALAVKINDLLRKNGISPPKWPANPGDPRSKAAMESLWHEMKEYRAKVRKCLIKNGVLDDPDVPKKLEDAIDFKGTCEDMCPEFEKVTRIMESDVKAAEKELSNNRQSSWPAPAKMVKKNARSAAGQDAPLPEDVRTAAALRQTLDYLTGTLLADQELAPVHNFIWDRTRGIRRDFTFQLSSMTTAELQDQVYCLEVITRYHVVALHQMSKDAAIAEEFEFVEQQEVEQLGKALLSLIHAYEDLDQNYQIICENREEFRAYYIIFNSHDTGILEKTQDWGYESWENSDDIRTAVMLVETLQNIWDFQGPLKPESQFSIAQNAFNRFFTILENPKVSYTTACFAEVHFNTVRKAALTAILSAYRKQRDQTRDWTMERINVYLRFDTVQDVRPFLEEYGLRVNSSGVEEYLDFEYGDSIKDPFPKLRQPHSVTLVERKRGSHSLPEAFHEAIYEDPREYLDENESMFVPESTSESGLPESIFEVPEIPKPQPESQPLFSWPQKAASDVVEPPTTVFTPQLQTPVQSSFTFPSSAKPAGQQALPSQNDLSLFTPTAASSPTAASQQASVPKATSVFGQGTGSSPGPFSFLNQTKTFDSTSAEQPRPSLFQTAPAPQSEAVQSPAEASPSASFVRPSVSASQSQNSFVPQIAPASPQSSTLFQGQPIGKQSSEAALHFQKSNPHSVFKSSPLNPKTLAQSPSLVFPPSVTTLNATTSAFELNNLVGTPKTNLESSKKNVKPPAPKVPTGLGTFPEWVVGEFGARSTLVDEFIRYEVEAILTPLYKQFLVDKEAEEYRHAIEMAHSFRQSSLARRYGQRWRNFTRQMWLKRKGRRARQMRREAAEESFRKSQIKIAEKVDVVDEFMKVQVESMKRSEKSREERLLAETRRLDTLRLSTESPMPTHFENQKTRPEDDTRKRRRRSDQERSRLLSSEGASTAQSKSTRTTQSSISPDPRLARSSRTTLHGRSGSRGSPGLAHSVRRIQTEDERKALIRKGLAGGSMILHDPNWTPEKEFAPENSRQISGVKTDYFRLKARGIVTLPDGTPLASSVANLMRKRSFSSSQAMSPPESLEESPDLRSTSKLYARFMSRSQRSPSLTTGNGDGAAAIVARAREIMLQDKEEKLRESKRRYTIDADAEEEKIKRVKEQMEEGSQWYREMIEEISRTG